MWNIYMRLYALLCTALLIVITSIILLSPNNFALPIRLNAGVVWEDSKIAGYLWVDSNAYLSVEGGLVDELLIEQSGLSTPKQLRLYRDFLTSLLAEESDTSRYLVPSTSEESIRQYKDSRFGMQSNEIHGSKEVFAVFTYGDYSTIVFSWFLPDEKFTAFDYISLVRSTESDAWKIDLERKQGSPVFSAAVANWVQSMRPKYRMQPEARVGLIRRAQNAFSSLLGSELPLVGGIVFSGECLQRDLCLFGERSIQENYDLGLLSDRQFDEWSHLKNYGDGSLSTTLIFGDQASYVGSFEFADGFHIALFSSESSDFYQLYRLDDDLVNLYKVKSHSRDSEILMDALNKSVNGSHK